VTSVDPTSPPHGLGLPALAAIGVGATLGVGAFVLPGMAVADAGPAAAIAYVVAGLVVLPAALSTAELATAMPEAGGTYLFVDRGMGPLMGTIAGLGVWASLLATTALALTGVGLHLEGLAGRLPGRAMAIGLAVVLTGLHLARGRTGGRVQGAIVMVTLVALVTLVVSGLATGDPTNLRPFAPGTAGSFLGAAGMVVVAYAGVTGVATVADRVRRPDRTIPLAILLTLGALVALHPALVLGLVAVLGVDGLGSATPTIDVAAAAWGTTGGTVMAVVAILSLVALAGAGVASASRYPAAMARNALAPAWLGRVGRRAAAPVWAVTVTGAVVVVLVLAVPAIELARFASALQLLVFAMVHLAVVAFRSSGVAWYQPSFLSPAHPLVAVVGIAGSLGLLVALGPGPLVVAAAIVAAGTLWYRAFGRSRASRESALLDAFRVRENERVVGAAAAAIRRDGVLHPLVLTRHNATPAKAAELVHLGDGLLHPGGHLHVVRLRTDTAGTTTPLVWDRILAPEDPAPKSTLTLTDADAADVAGHIRAIGIDLLIAELPPATRRTSQFVEDVRWVADNAGCDTAFVRYRGLAAIDHIVILGSGGPADALKLALAERLARTEGARLSLVHVVPETASGAQVDFIAEYQRRLAALCRVPVESRTPRASNLMTGIRTAVGADADLVVIGAPLETGTGLGLADRIMETLDTPVMAVGVRSYERQTLRRSLLQRVMY
jgi:amino acid transporter